MLLTFSRSSHGAGHSPSIEFFERPANCGVCVAFPRKKPMFCQMCAWNGMCMSEPICRKAVMRGKSS